ncbi:MAG: TatD family hydrolase [Bacteroidaceae bacterium]|nr:TatD family hydrolase [Bacteroidaceae bacterium]
MTDTHSHIYGPEFAEDIDAVVARAKAAGVTRILLPNINRSSIRPMLDLCNAHPDYLYPMMGLHPEDVAADYVAVLDEMEALLRASAHPYIAVGEVGLDFYWDTTFREEQMRAFRRQVEWALAYRLPLVIHCRSAHREMVDILNEYRDEPLAGIFHCFGGTLEEAEELLAFPGFVLGIGGLVTFRKSTLPDVLSHLPLNRIVLETDAPYLAPTPHRGHRNESAYIVHARDALAYIYNVAPEEVERCTDDAVLRIFHRLRA